MYCSKQWYNEFPIIVSRFNLKNVPTQLIRLSTKTGLQNDLMLNTQNNKLYVKSVVIICFNLAKESEKEKEKKLNVDARCVYVSTYL